MTNFLLPGVLASALFITTTVAAPPATFEVDADAMPKPVAAIAPTSASVDTVPLTKYITYDNRAMLTGDDDLTQFRLVEAKAEEEKPEPKPVITVAPKVTVPTVQPQPVVQPVAPTSTSNVAGANVASPNVLSEDQLNFLGSCEAGMNPAKNTGNGYYGAFQFSYGTWQSLNTGYERADLAPIEVQKEAVQRLVGRSNIFHQFPACASRMRNAGLI